MLVKEDQSWIRDSCALGMRAGEKTMARGDKNEEDEE